MKIFCGLRRSTFLCTLCDKGACVKAGKEQLNLQRVKLSYSFCSQWSSNASGQRGLCFCCVSCCFCFILAELKRSIHLRLSRCSLGCPGHAGPVRCQFCSVLSVPPFSWCCLPRSERSARRAEPGAVCQLPARAPCSNTTPWCHARAQLLSASSPREGTA